MDTHETSNSAPSRFWNHKFTLGLVLALGAFLGIATRELPLVAIIALSLGMIIGGYFTWLMTQSESENRF